MHQKQFTLDELAKLTNSELEGDPDYVITGIADLSSASAEDASFLDNPRYGKLLAESKAGVIFISPEHVRFSGKNYLLNEKPSFAFQKLIDLFFGANPRMTGFEGIHPTAVIHSSSKIGNNCHIGPHVVIDENVHIGDNTHIYANTYIGPETVIGKDCYIHPNVTIREKTVIGDRVILQPGCVIGSDGFGYIQDNLGRHVKLNHFGKVIIEDDVEIGANTTIDRARFKHTTIRIGSKIDNLVQIGHNVEIGPYNILVSQAGVAGSTKLGKYVVLSGQVGISGHLNIPDFTIIAAKSGVSKSLPKGGKWGGIPVLPIDEYNKMAVYLKNITKIVDQITSLEKKILEIQNKEVKE